MTTPTLTPPAVHERTFPALGTDVSLWLLGRANWDAPAAAAMERTVAFLHDAEQRWSRFNPDSELSRLNARAGGPVIVSPETFNMVALALRAAAGTAGLFDPTVLTALVAAGYDRSYDLIGGGRVCRVRGGRYPGRFRDVRLDRSRCTVTLPAGVGIDLGGIAKGWLADTIVRRLRRHGAISADLGGDIACSSPPPGQVLWEIELADPWDGERTLGCLLLRRGAVATSGTIRRRWQTADGPQHHLIDPRTGAPADSDLASVTIAGPAAMLAEVVAKVVLLLGRDAGTRFLERERDLAGILVGHDGRVSIAGSFHPRSSMIWQPQGGA